MSDGKLFLFIFFFPSDFSLKRILEADSNNYFVVTFSSDLGKYGKSEGTCIDCPKGWYSDSKAAEECTKCKLGELDNGATQSCSSCDLGKYGSSEGECSPCAAGTFQDTKGEPSCQKCPVDTYLSQEGKSSNADCTACPEKTTTNEILGRTEESACVCKDSFYRDPSSATLACVACIKEQTNCR